MESEEGEKRSGCVSKCRLPLVPPRLSDPSGLGGGADQTPSAGLSNPIVSGCHPTGKAPEELLRFLWTSGSPFWVPSAVFSKLVLLTDRPYVKSGRRCERCRKPCHGTNMQLNSALFDISKEMRSRGNKTKQKAKEREKKNNSNEHKTKRGLQAQQQHPGQD